MAQAVRRADWRSSPAPAAGSARRPREALARCRRACRAHRAHRRRTSKQVEERIHRRRRHRHDRAARPDRGGQHRPAGRRRSPAAGRRSTSSCSTPRCSARCAGRRRSTARNSRKVLTLNVLAPAGPDRRLRSDAAAERAPARVLGGHLQRRRAPRAYWGAYGASKAAFEALCCSLMAQEVGNVTPIRVAIVDPGATAHRDARARLSGRGSGDAQEPRRGRRGRDRPAESGFRERLPPLAYSIGKFEPSKAVIARAGPAPQRLASAAGRVIAATCKACSTRPNSCASSPPRP